MKPKCKGVGVHVCAPVGWGRARGEVRAKACSSSLPQHGTLSSSEFRSLNLNLALHSVVKTGRKNTLNLWLLEF